MSAAVLRSDPNHPDRPTSRTFRGLLGGIAAGVIVAIGVIVIAALFPGKNDWRTEGALVLDEDTGARYLYFDGTLLPVENMTTAQLLFGRPNRVVTLDSAALAGVPRGSPVGIDGVPELLPAAESLTFESWLACGVPADAGPPGLAVEIGYPDRGTVPASTEAVLVSGPDGLDHLVWEGKRLALDRAGVARQALGYGAATRRLVTTEFLNLVPEGPSLVPPAMSGRGEAGITMGGRTTRIGQVFSTSNQASYVLSDRGLVPLTATARALVLGDPRTQELAYQGSPPTVLEVGPQDVTSHLAPGDAFGFASWPSSPPRLMDATAAITLCVRTSADREVPTRSVVTVRTETLTGTPVRLPQPGIAGGCGPSPLVAVRGGTGVLLRTVPTGGRPEAWYLVGDNGVKYPLPSTGPPSTLGYGGTAPARLPTTLVNLLPTGPVLDPDLVFKGTTTALVTAALDCAA